MSINEALLYIGIGIAIFGCFLILINVILLIFITHNKLRSDPSTNQSLDAESITFLPGIFLVILGIAVLVMLKFVG